MESLSIPTKSYLNQKQVIEFKKEFHKHLNAFGTSPYLFIGSGLSRRYLKLPTWSDLLENFSKSLEFDKPYEYYYSKSENDLPSLASILAEEFHEIWWNSKSFKDSREKYISEAKKGKQQPFKIELANFITLENRVVKEYEEEIHLLKSAIIDGIITTNWDSFLNETFPEYNTYIGQQELLFAEYLSVGEIYKIHGCCSQPGSIVVTNEDYKNFNDKNAYLAAKLLTIFVEHPVVFLGYSISDKNIGEILTSLVGCVDNKNIDKLKNRLIFVEWVKNLEIPIIQDGTIRLQDGTALPIKHIKLDTYLPLYEVLGSIKQRLPIKILRKFKDAVYEYVKTNKPTDKIYIGDLNSANDINEIEFVVGVGAAVSFAERGLLGIDIKDIIEDIIFDNKHIPAKEFVEKVLPKLLKGKVFIPSYKYFRQANCLNDKGEIIKTDCFTEKILETFQANKIENYYPAPSYAKKKPEIRKKHKGVNDIVNSYDTIHSLYYIPLLDKGSINLDELKEFLQNCFLSNESVNSTEFKKVVCLYDYLKYGSNLK